MVSAGYLLSILKQYPEGIWIREFARNIGKCPATVCNYLYGYKDYKGYKRKGLLENRVIIERFGNGAITIIKPK